MIKEEKDVQIVEPTEEGTCPECYNKMIKRSESYICFKCGIKIEFKK